MGCTRNCQSEGGEKPFQQLSFTSTNVFCKGYCPPSSEPPSVLSMNSLLNLAKDLKFSQEILKTNCPGLGSFPVRPHPLVKSSARKNGLTPIKRANKPTSQLLVLSSVLISLSLFKKRPSSQLSSPGPPVGSRSGFAFRMQLRNKKLTSTSHIKQLRGIPAILGTPRRG